jgi:hypothetical protein
MPNDLVILSELQKSTETSQIVDAFTLLNNHKEIDNNKKYKVFFIIFFKNK